MAHNRSVIWQSDVARLGMRWTRSTVQRGEATSACTRSRCRGRDIWINDKSAFDIDLDAARANNGAVDLVGRRHGSAMLVVRRMRRRLGFVRNGILMLRGGRHGVIVSLVPRTRTLKKIRIRIEGVQLIVEIWS